MNIESPSLSNLLNIPTRRPGDFGRSPLGVNSIQNLDRLLADIQNRLPLFDSSVRNHLDSLPSWFRNLGTAEGLVRAESQLGQTIPDALRLFYRYPALGCWLLVNHDTDIFLETQEEDEKPRTVNWYYRQHMILATFHHSQTICAVQLNSDNPRIEWGSEGTKMPSDLPPCFFVQWLTRIAQEIVETLDGKPK